MTILQFLLIGGEITFPSGYRLKGDPSTSYIDTFLPDGQSDGLWILNEEGLQHAFHEEEKYRASLETS